MRRNPNRRIEAAQDALTAAMASSESAAVESAQFALWEAQADRWAKEKR